MFRDHGFIHFAHNMRARLRRAFNSQTHSASAVPQTNTIRCLFATTGIVKRGLLLSETRSKFNCIVFLSLLKDRMKACFYSFGFLLTSSHRFLLSKPSTSPLKSQTPHLDFQNLDSVLLCCVDFFIPSSWVNFKRCTQRRKTPWCHQRLVALLSAGLERCNFHDSDGGKKTWEEINGPNETSGTGVGLCCLVFLEVVNFWVLFKAKTSCCCAHKQTVILSEKLPVHLDLAKIYFKPAQAGLIFNGLLAGFRGVWDLETKPAKTRKMTWEAINGPNENSGTGVGLCYLVVQGQNETFGNISCLFRCIRNTSKTSLSWFEDFRWSVGRF